MATTLRHTVRRRSLPRYTKERMMKDLWLIPNLISIGRIIMIIPICILYPKTTSQTAYWAVVGLLLLSYLSDYADGYIARKYDQKSRLGLILDPLADKLWTLAMLVMLVMFRDFPFGIAASIVMRDILILVINIRMYKRIKRVLPSDDVGRKYMVMLGLMIIGATLGFPSVVWLGYGLIVFAIVTLYRYYIRVQNLLKESLMELGPIDGDNIT